MITLKSILEDAKINTKIDEANDTYFKSFTDAVEFARKATEKRGFTIDEDDWQTQIAFGGKYSRSRPSKGKTNSFTVHYKSLYLECQVVLMN